MKQQRVRLSFEFFPPKNDAALRQLSETVRGLAALTPEFVSITCGAGGSSIDGTFAVVKHIREAFGLTTVPHITFLRQNRTYLDEILRAYTKLGVHQVVALRGDPAVFGDAPELPPGDVFVNTVDFVAALKNLYGMEPIVAAYPDVHPLALSPQQDMDHLKRKVAAGARRAITQFFFEAGTFLRFRDHVRREDIEVELIPGIFPIQNLAQALKFAISCGAKVPAGFAGRFESCGNDPDALFHEGVRHATDLCDALKREGVEGFHFYTLNRNAMTEAVCSQLGYGSAITSQPTAGE